MSAALTLAQALSPYFEQASRARGYTYLGRVQLDYTGPPRMVTARVQGTERYRVRLERDGDVVRGECDCPAFDRVAPPFDRAQKVPSSIRTTSRPARRFRRDGGR